MKAWNLSICAIILVLAVASGGCASVSGEPQLSPQEVVTKFYRWYIGYPGNPLVDREYRQSPYLAQSYIQEVDQVVEGGFMADPVLLAQDIPESFTVGEADVSGDRASVVVSFYWGKNPTPAERRVDLELVEGEWKITDVSMVAP